VEIRKIIKYDELMKNTKTKKTNVVKSGMPTWAMMVLGFLVLVVVYEMAIFAKTMNAKQEEIRTGQSAVQEMQKQ
jgi:hypothetical protein